MSAHPRMSPHRRAVGTPTWSPSAGAGGGRAVSAGPARRLPVDDDDNDDGGGKRAGKASPRGDRSTRRVVRFAVHSAHVGSEKARLRRQAADATAEHDRHVAATAAAVVAARRALPPGVVFSHGMQKLAQRNAGTSP